MRVLVVGAGFLGGAIAETLAAGGATVALADCRLGGSADGSPQVPLRSALGVNPGPPRVPELTWIPFDAAIERNTPAALAAVRAFAPDAAVLAFGAGVAGGAGLRETMLVN